MYVLHLICIIDGFGVRFLVWKLLVSRILFISFWLCEITLQIGPSRSPTFRTQQKIRRSEIIKNSIGFSVKSRFNTVNRPNAWNTRVACEEDKRIEKGKRIRNFLVYLFHFWDFVFDVQKSFFFGETSRPTCQNSLEFFQNLKNWFENSLEYSTKAAVVYFNWW